MPKNKVGDQLRGFIERIERVNTAKKELTEDGKAIYAEAKASGFDTPILRKLISLRGEDSAKREQRQTLLDTYMHAIGMTSETPLFKAIGLLGVDIAARETIIEACGELVPMNGEITITTGGAKVRLWRDVEGNVHAEDVVDLGHMVLKEERAATHIDRAEADEVDIARKRGAKAAKEAPGAKNPYRKGDKLHGEWIAGFREAMEAEPEPA